MNRIFTVIAKYPNPSVIQHFVWIVWIVTLPVFTIHTFHTIHTIPSFSSFTPLHYFQQKCTRSSCCKTRHLPNVVSPLRLWLQRSPTSMISGDISCLLPAQVKNENVSFFPFLTKVVVIQTQPWEVSIWKDVFNNSKKKLHKRTTLKL